jgi:hypothetical protein
MAKKENKDKSQKIDLEQSTEDLILERWGKKVGKKLIQCIRKCMKKDKETNDIKDCFKKCVREEISEDEITDERLGIIIDHLDNYETIGR